MALSPVQCPKCKRPFDQIPDWGNCPDCGSLLHIEVFPAFFAEKAAGQVGEVLMLEGESSCFYHPSKRAVLPCEACGRFVCALCDCELQGRHFCPACLEAGRTKGKIRNLEGQRTLYDTLALALAVLPLATVFFWFMSLFTAPIVIFICIRYWNAPRSIVHRSRARYVIAMILAILQIVGWGLGIYYIAGSIRA